MSSAARLGLKHSQPMYPLGCATAKNHRPFAQWRSEISVSRTCNIQNLLL